MYSNYEDDDGIMHVVPCDEEGECLPSHYFSHHCPCCPEIIFENGEAVIIHNQIH